MKFPSKRNFPMKGKKKVIIYEYNSYSHFTSSLHKGNALQLPGFWLFKRLDFYQINNEDNKRNAYA